MRLIIVVTPLKNKGVEEYRDTNGSYVLLFDTIAGQSVAHQDTLLVVNVGGRAQRASTHFSHYDRAYSSSSHTAAR